MSEGEKKFSRFGYLTLSLTLLVILWGAFVRLSGSGDGCGASWPLCQGVLIPKSPTIEMAIEFLHRASSGVAFLLVLGMWIWSRRLFAPEALARKASGAALLFMITESLFGAALVLFEWVDTSTASARVVALALHQINTLLLISSIFLAAWLPRRDLQLNADSWGRYSSTLIMLYVGFCLAAAFGVVAALSSGLYPTDSLIQGMQYDFDPDAPLIVRLRILHPIISVLVTLFVVRFVLNIEKSAAPRSGGVLLVLISCQILCGIVTWLSHGSVVLKLLHLLLADVTVIVFTALAAELVLQKGQKYLHESQTTHAVSAS